MPDRKPILGVAVAAAVAAATPFIMTHEGVVTHPYHDPAGIETVCAGETHVAMRNYTVKQCGEILLDHLDERYAPAVLNCTPDVADHPKVLEAALDAAYNAGPAAYCRSPMAVQFRSDNWTAGCDAFRGWHISAGGTVLPGLVRRREDEAELCSS
jgi:lysozyme